MHSTKISFDIYNTSDCKTLGVLDTSFYQSTQPISNATLQIISPFDNEPVELNYYKNALTVLNSNNLGITNVNDLDYLQELPDGLYTAKMSICPEEIYWFEKSWYRTCLLECKYDKAFLKLNVNSCEACYNPEKIKALDRAELYMNACVMQAKNCNIKEATKLYNASNKILDSILNCSCNDVR